MLVAEVARPSLDVPAARGQDARARAVAAVSDRRQLCRAAFPADLLRHAMACLYFQRRFEIAATGYLSRSTQRVVPPSALTNSNAQALGSRGQSSPYSVARGR